MENINNKIVAEARTWLGTPFKHQGRLKNIGVDCLGLVVGVLSNLRIKIEGQDIKNFDQKNYSLLPDGVLLKQNLDKYFTAKPTSEMLAGDILLIKFSEQPQHLAIVTEQQNIKNKNPNEENTNAENNFGIIHSYLQAGKVVEHSLDKRWLGKVICAYSIYKLKP